MCSILGQINFEENKINHKEIMNLNSMLKHRGPDDEGYYRDANTSLAFNRLSIIDLKNGNQPVNTYNIVSIFNGEIYNFKELKIELIEKGFKFKTKSDSEVIPVVYKAWGIDGFKRLRGMFSICLYDLNIKKIFLVRDQIGIKPLYYFLINDGIIFASEIKSLINHSKFKKEINYNAITSYLSHRYTVNNKSLFFKNIKQVNESSFIEISIKNKKISEHEYYNLTVKTESTDRGENYYLELIEDKLQQSVNRHLISDVPISVFLSGGLDSSLLSSMTSKKLDYRINTFSVGFDNINYDESNFANLVSKYIGSNHNNIKIQKSNFLENIKKIIKIKSTPASIPHEYPLYLLSSEIKKKNKVVLSGEGADEFFGGYDRVFDWSLKNRFTVEKFCDFYCYNKINKDSLEFLNLKKFFNKLKKLSCFEKVKFFFIKFHLPILLRRLDFSLMSEGIEGREPFLSKEVFIESMKYNKNELMRDKLGKRPLRTISKKYFGQKFASLKKVGFPIDMSRIIKYKNGRISNYNLWFRLNQKILMELK